MSDPLRTVAVVGGGIGGLTAALLLSRLGHEVTLFEKHTRTVGVGAGLLLAPNGLAVFDALGVGNDLREAGHVMHRSAVLRANGALVMPLTFGGGGEGLDHAVAITRRALHRRLWAALEQDDLVRLRTGLEVIDVQVDGQLWSKPKGGPQSSSYDVIVGADGVHSLARTRGRFDAEVTSTGQTYVRGLVPTSQAPSAAGEYWTRLGIFGGAPVGDGLTYFYASGTQLQKAIERQDLDAFRSAWAEELPSARSTLEAVSNFSDLLVNQVERVDCAAWVDQRVVLIGDAAHAMAPTLGQGANSAVVDAAVLAQELTSSDLAGALDAYQCRRLPAVRRVQDTADRITKLSTTPGTVRPWLRDRILRAASRSTGSQRRQRRLVDQEDPPALRRSLAEHLS